MGGGILKSSLVHGWAFRVAWSRGKSGHRFLAAPSARRLGVNQFVVAMLRSAGLPANKALQGTFDPPPIFAAAKTGVASNAAELRRWATRKDKEVLLFRSQCRPQVGIIINII